MTGTVPEELPMTIDASTATIRDCIHAIQRGGGHIALATDRRGVFVGIVTDGHLRRAWLAGRSLDDPASPLIERAPFTVKPTESRAAILDLMQALGISQVPVVSSDGRLAGLHLMREFMGHAPLSATALILAGGRGTRLGSLTTETPKPMIPVAGRPILERIIIHLVGHGIREITLAVGFQAESIIEYFGDGSAFGCRVSYLREDPAKPLGTGGPVATYMERKHDVVEPLVVMNGDLVTQFDVKGMLDFHLANEASVTVGSFTYSHEVPFGVLSVDQTGRLTGIEEKPLRLETVSAGIYVFNPQALSNLPVGEFLPVTTLLAELVASGHRIQSWDCGQDWIDIGQPTDLARARGQI